MNKTRTRAILAFMFLVLFQIACGCSIDHEVVVHVYQDFNGNSTQDSDEPGFPGIEVSNDSSFGYFKTNNNGDITVNSRDGGNDDCSDYWPGVNTPSGYTITENNRNPAQWDFRSVLLFLPSECPSIFALEQQNGSWTIGFQPTFEMTKTASPTTFSAPGETITYTYVIANTTANGFSQVSVSDDKTAVTCPANSVAAGESMTCTATYVTSGEDLSRGSITNTAQYTATVALIDYYNYGYNLNITSAPVSATVTLESSQQESVHDAEVTCECDGTIEVSSYGTQIDNASACIQLPALSGPLLTGDVYTLCDTSNRWVNLKLVAGTDNALVTQELANGNLQILIGGTDISSTCKINPSNTTLLTCTYPAGLTSLPAEGQVIYKTTVLQTFRFDGESGCAGSSSGSTKTEPDTCDPNEPGTPCFCEENPYDESCATE